MIRLFSPSQARIPIGSVVINGRVYEVAVNTEWAKYFDSMTNTANDLTTAAAAGRNGVDGPATSLLGGGDGEAVEFIPGPQGLRGERGEGGPVVGFLSGEDSAPEFIPGPPGPQGRQGDAGPALFILQEPETNDIFWPIKAG